MSSDVTVVLNDNSDVTVTAPPADVQAATTPADVTVTVSETAVNIIDIGLGGGGNISGPGSTTDNAVVRWDGTTGRFIQNSGVTIDDDSLTTIGGGGTQVPFGGAGSYLQTINNGGVTFWDQSWVNYGNTSGLGGFVAAKTRGATSSTHAAVQNNDPLFWLQADGSDGTDFTTAALLQVFVDGVPGPGIVPGRWSFSTRDFGGGFAERLRISSEGNIGNGPLFGTLFDTPLLQILNYANPVGTIVNFGTFSDNNVGTLFEFTKSRNATVGSHTIVQNGDNIADIVGVGSDGVDWQQAANIKFHVDGVPGLGDMPGRISLWTTPDASATPVERWRIDSAGRLNNAGQAAVSMDDLGPLLINGTSDQTSRPGIFRWENDESGPTLQLGHSRSTTIGGHGILLDGDQLASIRIYGDDGVNFRETAGIYFDVQGAPVSGVSVPSSIRFHTNEAERLLIDSAGRVLIAGTTIPSVSGQTTQHLVSTAGGTFNYHAHYFGNDGGTASLGFSRSKSGVQGVPGLVANGDNLAQIAVYAADTSQFVRAGLLLWTVDGTPGTLDMPTRLGIFLTPDGGSDVVERMRLDSLGRLNVAMGNSSGSMFTSGDSIELGNDRAGDGVCLIDLHASTGVDYSTRLIRQSGVNAFFLLQNTGTGSVILSSGGDFQVETNGTAGRMIMTTDGNTAFGAWQGIGGLTPFASPTAGVPVITTVTGAVSGKPNIAMFATNDFAGDNQLQFLKTRANTANGHVIVQTDDILGSVTFWGSNGAGNAYKQAGFFRCFVQGTPGTGDDMPGCLELGTTPDGSSSPITRIQVNNSGHAGFTVNGSFTGWPWTFDVPSGTTVPALQVFGTGFESAIGIVRFSTSNAGRLAIARSNNNTVGTFTTGMGTGQTLGEISFNGSDTVGLDMGAAIRAVTSEAWTSTVNGARLEFMTTPNGSTTTAIVATLNQDGHLLLHAGGMAGIASTAQRFQIQSSNAEFQIGLFNGGANSGANHAIVFAKTRDADVGSPATGVSNGDALGRLLFYGADGDQFNLGAVIEAKVDGTAANNDLPTRLDFSVTPDGSTTPALVLTLGQTGNAYFNDNLVGARNNGDDNHGTIWGNLTAGSDGLQFRGFGGFQWHTGNSGATEIASMNADHFRVLKSTGIPAGGATGKGYQFSSTANFGVFFGSGAPSLSAAKGSLYLRSDGSSTTTRAYINTDGGTTWTNIVTSA